jgi:hypothetical protein
MRANLAHTWSALQVNVIAALRPKWELSLRESDLRPRCRARFMASPRSLEHNCSVTALEMQAKLTHDVNASYLI